MAMCCCCCHRAVRCPAISAASLEGRQINWRELSRTVGGGDVDVEMKAGEERHKVSEHARDGMRERGNKEGRTWFED
ncbi:hypothetical protein EYF80_015458 [Liparis tanakae]|uniref:Uncharacterized protein n=1 Tax=Liparis tanakae TaxID=230148 RepID=A0A4Z2I9Y6_9TELE|nr:hypothetical protein EYF80_015458 [Liparis tanakae]